MGMQKHPTTYISTMGQSRQPTDSTSPSQVYTKARKKIAEAKAKDDDERTDEEIISQILEDRRRMWREKAREKRIKKKQEIERILAIPESERTKEDLLTLEAFTKEKQKKSERNIYS